MNLRHDNLSLPGSLQDMRCFGNEMDESCNTCGRMNNEHLVDARESTAELNSYLFHTYT